MEKIALPCATYRARTGRSWSEKASVLRRCGEPRSSIHLCGGFVMKEVGSDLRGERRVGAADIVSEAFPDAVGHFEIDLDDAGVELAP